MKLQVFKRLTIDIDENLHSEFKSICAEKKIDMKEVVTEFIVKYVNLHKRRKR